MNATPLPPEFRNRIIHGDALDVMATMPDGCVQVVIASPPYNLARHLRPSSEHWRNAALARGYDGYADNLPDAEYVEWQRACLTEMLRLIPETGAVFYNQKWRIHKGRLNDRRAILDGFPVRQIIIWRRPGGLNFNPAFFAPSYEVIYLLTKLRFRLVPGGQVHTDVWSIPREQRNPHPAPFPVEIPHRILTATGARSVLDPFMGSGTTAVAATQLGRTFVGIEQSAMYCRMAEARIADARQGR